VRKDVDMFAVQIVLAVAERKGVSRERLSGARQKPLKCT